MSHKLRCASPSQMLSKLNLMCKQKSSRINLCSDGFPRFFPLSLVTCLLLSSVLQMQDYLSLNVLLRLKALPTAVASYNGAYLLSQIKSNLLNVNLKYSIGCIGAAVIKTALL